MLYNTYIYYIIFSLYLKHKISKFKYRKFSKSILNKKLLKIVCV